MEQSEANLGIVSREHMEKLAESFQLDINDFQWEKMRNEIEGRVENYVEGLLDDLILDLQDGRFDD